MALEQELDRCSVNTSELQSSCKGRYHCSCLDQMKAFGVLPSEPSCDIELGEPQSLAIINKMVGLFFLNHDVSPLFLFCFAFVIYKQLKRTRIGAQRPV